MITTSKSGYMIKEIGLTFISCQKQLANSQHSISRVDFIEARLGNTRAFSAPLIIGSGLARGGSGASIEETSSVSERSER